MKDWRYLTGKVTVKSRSKYGAKKVKADGITFDSKAEYARYLQLKLLEKAGGIFDIIVHPHVPLIVNNKKIGAYTGDFEYTDADTERTYLEDVKGVKTPVYRLKKKILEANGIKITEIDAKDLKIRRR